MLNFKEDKSTMIETDFYILSQEQYQENLQFANELGVTIDYFLLEFCDVQGPYVTTN
jgi:hypothetical protein